MFDRFAYAAEQVSYIRYIHQPRYAGAGSHLRLFFQAADSKFAYAVGQTYILQYLRAGSNAGRSVGLEPQQTGVVELHGKAGLFQAHRQIAYIH